MAGRGPHRMPNGEKPKNLKKSLGKLIKYSKKYFPVIIFAIILSAIGVGLVVYGPNKVQEITNLITASLQNMAMFGIWNFNLSKGIGICVLLLIIYSLGFILNYVQGIIMASVTQRVTKNLRGDISKKINNLPLKYVDKTPTGDILSRVTNDVDTIGQSLNNSVVSLVSSICLFLGSLVMMIIKNWIMALTAVFATIFGFAIMVLILSKSQKYFVRQQGLLGELNGHIEEVYSGHNIVKAYNAEDKCMEKFKEVNGKLFQSGWKSQFFSGLMGPLMNFIGNFGFVSICIVGAVLVANNKVDFGAITAFMIYVNLFSSSLSQMAQVFSSVQSTAAASERVFEFLGEQELSDESKKKESLTRDEINGNVTFKNVRFGYDIDKTIIKNFTASIKAGQKVAIVGPTGAGKTTMVNLLMRFYEINQPRLILGGKLTNYKIFDYGKSIRLSIADSGNLIVNGTQTNFTVPTEVIPMFKFGEIKFDQDFNIISNDKIVKENIEVVTGNNIDKPEKYNFAIAYFGDILIDNKPVNSLTRKNIHDLFGMVLQDTWIFEGSVRENIVYSKENVPDDEVVSACKACGIHHFIMTLPNGYDTVLTDNINISAGQKQLLTIARAMVQNSPMLILDEATSSVDTRTEILIQKSMDKITENRTSFVIAHRLSTIKNADQILVMKDGDIVEMGNHDELILKNGFYAELYNSQFQEV